jgi:hypothetical protein
MLELKYSFSLIPAEGITTSQAIQILGIPLHSNISCFLDSNLLRALPGALGQRSPPSRDEWRALANHLLNHQLLLKFQILPLAKTGTYRPIGAGEEISRGPKMQSSRMKKISLE